MNSPEKDPQKEDPFELRRRNMADYLAELIVQAAKGEISDEDFGRAIEAAKRGYNSHAGSEARKGSSIIKNTPFLNSCGASQKDSI